MANRSTLFPLPRTVPELCRITRRRQLSLKAWRALGRPYWVVQADERYRSGKNGALSTNVKPLFYRVAVPLCNDLDIIIRTSDYTTGLRVGGTVATGMELAAVEPAAVALVEPDQADAREGRWPNTVKVHMWDRNLRPDDAQLYAPEEPTREKVDRNPT